MSVELPPALPAGEDSGSHKDDDSSENAVPGDAVVGTETLVGSPPDVAPDGGYGWVCVFCFFIINFHTWGINSAYGVFLADYLSKNSISGGSPLSFAFIGGLSVSQALLISPLPTYVTRRFGTRTTLLIGATLESSALIGASFAHSAWHLFLSQGLLFGWGMGFLFVGSVGIVPQWFHKRRSLANGMGTSGGGLGGLVYSLATQAMIQHISIAWAFRILAILAFTANTTAALLMRDRNKILNSRQNLFDYRLFSRVEFRFMMGWSGFSMLGYIVLLFSLPDYAQSVGLSPSQGALMGALLNLGQGVGRIALGWVSDPVGRINIASLFTALAGLFCFVVWIFAKSYGVLIFFSILIGFFCGVFWPTVAPVTAEVVGIRELPSALSMTWFWTSFFTLFAEPIGLKLRSSSGDMYLRCQIFTACMYIGASLCILYVRGWKIMQRAGELSVGKEKGAVSEETGDYRPSWIRAVRYALAWSKV